MQQPAVAGLDRHPGVAERVAGQRDQQHLGAEAGQDAHALEAEPLVAFAVVPDPARAVLPVGGEVARAGRAGCGCSAASSSRPKTWTSASGKSGRPPEWSGSRWVVTMWRTSPAAKPSASSCFSAVSRARPWGASARRRGRAGAGCGRPPCRSRCRAGRARRRSRSPGSGRRLRPCSSRPPSPLISRAPWGHSDPQLRWWIRIPRGSLVAGQRFGPTCRSMTATAFRRATETFQGPSCRQAMSSRSQVSQKMRWISSERLVKK